MRTTRRELLLGGAALGGTLLMPRPSRAAVRPEDRKFIFVWVTGGWDPTKVFMPNMGETIGRNEGDEPSTYGNFHIVSNPNRPAVDAFYQAYNQKIVMLNGMLIRSINHPICRNLWMTNSPNAARPDWPATIGYDSADRYPVPHIIVAGYSMAGAYSAYTALSGRGGQLQQLVSGSALARGNEPHLPPPMDVQALMDEFAAKRAGQRAAVPQTEVEGRLTEAYRQAANRMIEFKDATAGIDLDGGNTITTQIPLAMRFLQNGIARCVTLAHGGGLWDTHVDNTDQDALFDDLFVNLGQLMVALETTPGRDAPTLADETVVTVFSEMGRAPFFNSTGGKDHWMYSSAMMWGPGIQPGREIGGYDENLNGLTLDFASSEVVSQDDGGVAMTPDVLGSTLLTLAGIDPVQELGKDTTLRGILS